MKSIYWVLFICLLAVGFSCSKYDPIYGVANSTNNNNSNLRYDMAYIFDNEVYLTDEILSEQIQLTNNAGMTNTAYTSKTHVALSPALDKIAYLDANNTPVIIDNEGNEIDKLTQYTNVSDIGWHNNNGNPTLYIIVNNSIEFYGPSLNLVNNPFNFVFPSAATYTIVDAVDINENLDIAFTYRYYEPFSPTSSFRRYYYGVAIQYNNSAANDRNKQYYQNYYDANTQSYESQLYNYYHMIQFNDLNGGMDIAETVNMNESNINNHWIRNYQPSSASTSTVNSISSACFYQQNQKGNVAANIYRIQKYLVNLPPGTPPPTGTANTFVLDFNTSNDQLPTCFDWQP